MNILFFLKPKINVAYIYDTASLRQTIEKMEHYRYSAVPIISKEGKYVGTLSEGDILWYIKNKKEFKLEESEDVNILDIKRYRDNKPVKIDTDIEELIAKSKDQNFIPVIDDRDVFIGIVTRHDIITYFFENCDFNNCKENIIY